MSRFAVGALGLVTIAGCSASGRAEEPPAVSVAANDCGTGWTALRAGAQTVVLRNTGGLAADVQFIDVATDKVLVDVEGVGSGATLPIRLDLGGGRYAVRCVFDGLGAVTGPTVRVEGPAGPTGVKPVTRADLVAPVQAYQASVAAGMAPLVTDTEALRAAVASGDRDRARAAWLTALLDYQRLGAAYGAFGDLDSAINGLPGGLAEGVHDPEFTGFRRLEYGLWHDEPLPALGPVADALLRSVTALRDQSPELAIDGLDLTRRVHEILEDTSRFELTGESDQGSGSALAVARAQVQATQAALEPLVPLLAGRYAALPQVDPALRRLADDLDTFGHNGVWTPLTALDHTQRQRINAEVGNAVELLAPIAAICEPRRTS
ncbi:EfeM/EfeO family lipoprotein [Pseudonocardia spinosispora]|uniref:EfeM/EfeO family lipoprotein n=1 Tax=Pseudonocardia spinosispora TaxID=103441 RepID=UPI00048EFEDD|nr:EfeM/EfeO family lipoprotein [Pseudonocardia spinosispora]